MAAETQGSVLKIQKKGPTLFSPFSTDTGDFPKIRVEELTARYNHLLIYQDYTSHIDALDTVVQAFFEEVAADGYTLDPKIQGKLYRISYQEKDNYDYLISAISTAITTRTGTPPVDLGEAELIPESGLNEDGDTCPWKFTTPTCKDKAITLTVVEEEAIDTEVGFSAEKVSKFNPFDDSQKDIPGKELSLEKQLNAKAKIQFYDDTSFNLSASNYKLNLDDDVTDFCTDFRGYASTKAHRIQTNFLQIHDTNIDLHFNPSYGYFQKQDTGANDLYHVAFLYRIDIGNRDDLETVIAVSTSSEDKDQALEKIKLLDAIENNIPIIPNAATLYTSNGIMYVSPICLFATYTKDNNDDYEVQVLVVGAKTTPITDLDNAGAFIPTATSGSYLHVDFVVHNQLKSMLQYCNMYRSPNVSDVTFGAEPFWPQSSDDYWRGLAHADKWITRLKYIIEGLPTAGKILLKDKSDSTKILALTGTLQDIESDVKLFSTGADHIVPSTGATLPGQQEVIKQELTSAQAAKEHLGNLPFSAVALSIDNVTRYLRQEVLLEFEQLKTHITAILDPTHFASTEIGPLITARNYLAGAIDQLRRYDTNISTAMKNLYNATKAVPEDISPSLQALKEQYLSIIESHLRKLVAGMPGITLPDLPLATTILLNSIIADVVASGSLLSKLLGLINPDGSDNFFGGGSSGGGGAGGSFGVSEGNTAQPLLGPTSINEADVIRSVTVDIEQWRKFAKQLDDSISHLLDVADRYDELRVGLRTMRRQSESAIDPNSIANSVYKGKTANAADIIGMIENDDFPICRQTLKVNKTMFEGAGLPGGAVPSEYWPFDLVRIVGEEFVAEDLPSRTVEEAWAKQKSTGEHHITTTIDAEALRTMCMMRFRKETGADWTSDANVATISAMLHFGIHPSYKLDITGRLIFPLETTSSMLLLEKRVAQQMSDKVRMQVTPEDLSDLVSSQAQFTRWAERFFGTGPNQTVHVIERQLTGANDIVLANSEVIFINAAEVMGFNFDGGHDGVTTGNLSGSQTSFALVRMPDRIHSATVIYMRFMVLPFLDTVSDDVKEYFMNSIRLKSQYDCFSENEYGRAADTISFTPFSITNNGAGDFLFRPHCNYVEDKIRTRWLMKVSRDQEDTDANDPIALTDEKLILSLVNGEFYATSAGTRRLLMRNKWIMRSYLPVTTITENQKYKVINLNVPSPVWNMIFASRSNKRGLYSEITAANVDPVEYTADSFDNFYTVKLNGTQHGSAYKSLLKLIVKDDAETPIAWAKAGNILNLKFIAGMAETPLKTNGYTLFVDKTYELALKETAIVMNGSFKLLFDFNKAANHITGQHKTLRTLQTDKTTMARFMLRAMKEKLDEEIEKAHSGLTLSYDVIDDQENNKYAIEISAKMERA